MVTTATFISKTGYKVKVDINFLSSLFLLCFFSSTQHGLTGLDGLSRRMIQTFIYVQSERLVALPVWDCCSCLIILTMLGHDKAH